MGKHERKNIEEAEKILIKLLNSKTLSSVDKKNHWSRQAVKLAERISKDFPIIKKAQHLGNRYDTVGDIMIKTDKGEKYFEVKMSDSKLGIGTKANISQNALTEYRLFKNKAKSWKEFRSQRKHQQWVMKLLTRFKNYPPKITKLDNPTILKEEQARYLRRLRGQGDKKARQILAVIRKRDQQEKIDYLSYLRRQAQNRERVKRFMVLIIAGVHTKEKIKNYIEQRNFLGQAMNFLVYYSNLNNGQILIRKEEVGRRIKQILKQYQTFKIVFPYKVTHCKLMGVRNNNREPLLQIVLHWKNISQGIKTPCLNIFDLST